MKKLLSILIAGIVICSCNKNITRELPGEKQVTPVDESVVLRPPGGYSSEKRADDFVASQLKGKPVKNNVANITDLRTAVISPYQINLNFTGIRNVVSYNIYRDDILVGNTIQPLYSDYGLQQNTTYKYQVAGVASNGSVGNLSNISYGTTMTADIESKVIVFLQFDKDTTYDPGWIAYSGGLPLITEASGFNEQEQQDITDGITVDYAQFQNIKVTRNKTEWLSALPERRLKTIFTQSYEWFSGPTPTAGGVSYLNTLGLDRTNFVFSSALYYNVYYNVVAGTHENGHAIGGLHHAVDYCGQGYGTDGNHMGAAYSNTFRFFNYHLASTCGYEDQVTTLNSRTQ